ncbi:amidohydrolase family protein [Wenzhouxiangella sp. EGI_FJ10305]|uniref:amidohydrolase family protein n=1 Tax=Wenzhouxiangella sp. EGI_FJ10305 TaxID=3243768 RepID=UPI0035E02882
MNRYCILMIATLAAGAAVADDMALVGATVHDGTRGPALEDGVILVADGRITCVGSRVECATTEQFETVDLSGRHITPGLVDGHVHYAQTGWLDGRPDSRIGTDHYDYEALQRSLRDDPGRWHRAYLCSGITAVYDVGGLPWTVELAQADEAPPQRPHYKAAGPLITHYEPVFGVMSAMGTDTFLPMDSDEAARESVEQLVDMGAQAIKVWYLDSPANQREAMDERIGLIGEAAREAGLPLIVHATELRNAKAALRAGAQMLVHSVEDQPVDEEFLELMRANGTFYAPTLTVSGNWARAVASVRLGVEAPEIDDPNGCVDAETRRVVAEADEFFGEPSPAVVEGAFSRLEATAAGEALMQRNLLRVFEAGVPIVTSTDAGNPLTLHGPSIYAEMEAMQSAGISQGDIIRMSTRNGAAAMGRLDDFGTLEAGKLADLIVLEDDPSKSAEAFRSITHVMRAGALAPITEYAEE